MTRIAVARRPSRKKPIPLMPLPDLLAAAAQLAGLSVARVVGDVRADRANGARWAFVFVAAEIGHTRPRIAAALARPQGFVASALRQASVELCVPGGVVAGLILDLRDIAAEWQPPASAMLSTSSAEARP